MALDPAYAADIDARAGTVAALILADGSASQHVPRALVAPLAPMRDLADAVHALCMLHGRYPGAIDHATRGNDAAIADHWLTQAAEAFSVERSYLAHLTAAAGPLPSTPGQAQSDAAIVSQTHALDMLAQSGRPGCAIGASAALILDWRAVRRVLDAAALRFGVMPPPLTLPLDAETMSLVATLADKPALERAMAFGAQQVLAQHRGLWDLLDARRSARDEQ